MCLGLAWYCRQIQHIRIHPHVCISHKREGYADSVIHASRIKKKRFDWKISHIRWFYMGFCLFAVFNKPPKIKQSFPLCFISILIRKRIFSMNICNCISCRKESRLAGRSFFGDLYIFWRLIFFLKDGHQTYD